MNHYEQAQERAFALHRSNLVTRTALENLKRLSTHSVPYALPASKPLSRQGTAVVIGAGPDLSERLDWLRGIQGKATLIAVNAAMPGLAKAGIQVDYLVCREALDQSPHLKHGGFKRAVFDMATNANCWEVARDQGAEVRAFVPAGVPMFDLAHALQVRPLYAGTAALTGAVALASELGARSIVLVGVDLAILGSSIYSPAAAYGSVGVTVQGNQVQLSNTNERNRGAIAVGATPESDARSLPEVPCWDGTDRLTMWLDQINWLSAFGVRHWESIELYDTCMRGAKKSGWRATRDPELYGPLPEHEHASINEARISDFLSHVRGDASWLAGISANLQSLHHMAPRLTTGFVEALSLRGLTLARDHQTVPEIIAGTYQAIGEQCAWVEGNL